MIEHVLKNLSAACRLALPCGSACRHAYSACIDLEALRSPFIYSVLWAILSLETTCHALFNKPMRVDVDFGRGLL